LPSSQRGADERKRSALLVDHEQRGPVERRHWVWRGQLVMRARRSHHRQDANRGESKPDHPDRVLETPREAAASTTPAIMLAFSYQFGGIVPRSLRNRAHSDATGLSRSCFATAHCSNSARASFAFCCRASIFPNSRWASPTSGHASAYRVYAVLAPSIFPCSE